MSKLWVLHITYKWWRIVTKVQVRNYRILQGIVRITSHVHETPDIRGKISAILSKFISYTHNKESDARDVYWKAAGMPSMAERVRSNFGFKKDDEKS